MKATSVPPSKQKLDRIHDALKQHVADGKLPGTVVLVARKGKIQMPPKKLACRLRNT